MSFRTPILLLIFNRPKLTKKVIDAIAKQKPKKLYIAADGPRGANNGELELCKETRDVVLNSIDWECEVKILFRDSNLGCAVSVSSAITWFFSHVEEGIILEDDCVPNNSFFYFCEELLEKYRYNNKISAISGNNFQLMQPMDLESDYYYSVFPSSWGWATWKRSWEGYDLFISSWGKIDKKSILTFLFKEKEYQLWWNLQFDMFYLNKGVDTWDYQFHYHTMARKQLCIIPKSNLVSNIGYGVDSTHFHNPDKGYTIWPTYEMEFPLAHPTHVIRNYEADLYVQNLLFGKAEVVNFYKKTKRLLKKLVWR